MTIGVNDYLFVKWKPPQNISRKLTLNFTITYVLNENYFKISQEKLTVDWNH
jgi:hypothetical protein